MRKIQFDLQIADGFHEIHIDSMLNPRSDIVMDVPNWKSEYIHEIVEFEPQGGDIMVEATHALSVQMAKDYPNKEYRIEYWWWGE
jgi:hypothetical protein